MASADEKQQLKGLNVLNLGMLEDGMNYIQEIEQNSPHVFDMLYNFVSSSASAPVISPARFLPSSFFTSLSFVSLRIEDGND